MKNGIKLFAAFLLAAFAFISCENFITDNMDFKERLQEEVHDSTATVLNVKVQALPGQGNAYASTDTVKLDVAFQASFEVDTSYGVFNYWKAYANYEKENQKELTEEDIWFSKATALTTEVKILKTYSDIRIIPYCTRHPQINVIMPSGLVNPGSLTPLGPQTIEVGKEYTITMQTSTDYGFTGWKIYAMEGDKEAELKIDEEYTAIEYEPEVSESSKNLGATKASIAIRVAKPLSKSIYIEPILYEYPDVIVQFPAAYQTFPDEIGTLSPAGTKKMRTGSEYTVKLVTRPEYGFRGWRIYTVSGGTEVDLFTNSALTEAGQSLLLAMEGETTVSKGSATEGATTTSISVELLKVPDTAIYIEPEVYPYSGLMIMNYLDSSDTYDENAILTPGHGTNRNIIVGEEYTVKIKTSTAYGFNCWDIFELLSDGSKKYLVKGTDYTTPFDDSETAEANSSGIITVSTTFSFNREFDNPVYIVPNVYKYPRLFVSLGAKYASLTQTELAEIGSISPETGELGRAIVSGSENKITLKTTESYGFTGWKFSTESGVDAPALDTEYYDVISNDSVYSTNGTTATMVVVFDKSLEENVYIEPILSGYPSAYIQLSNSAAGSVTPAGLQKIMIDRDYTISLQTHSDYGFSGWKFYNSSDQNSTRTEFPVYIDGGDNSHVNTSGTYIYMTSNSNPDTNEDIVKNASLIVYNTIKDTSSSGGSVKASAYIRMTKKIEFICIEGKVTTNPIINFATPKYNSSDEAGSITPLGSTRQSADNEFTVSVRLNDLYSFDGWQLSNGSSFKTLTDYFDIKSQNINANKSEATAVLEILPGVNVDGYTISAKTKIRPQVRDTSPAASATGVVRTPDITIVFTKPIAITASNYTDYFSIVSRASMVASSSTNVIDKFAMGTSTDKQVVTFKFDDKKNSANWLPSTGYITVTVMNNLEDEDGVILGKNYAFSFTTGTSGDSEGPIISSAKLTSGSTTLTAASSTQAYWGDWELSTGAESDHVYADSFRTKGSDSDTFTATISASDETTGNTGVSGYSVIQRLMYVPKGGRLPKTSKPAESDMTFFSEDGVWKGLSGCMPADYEKEIPLTLKSGSTDTFTAFALSSDFKDSSDRLVDGIYMLELTAKDGLGNKSGNPARYFIVRDTTAPSAKENEGKLYISDGGVLVGGKRYFGSGKTSVTVGFNSALTDFGTQGQPWTASKPANMQWDAALSSSDESFASVSDATWQGYSNLSTKTKTFTIPSSYLSGNDKKLYVWFKLKDDLGHECAPAFATNAVVYIDVQKPDFPTITSGNARFEGSTIYLSSSTANVKFEATDSSATNCSSGCKIVVKRSGTAISPAADGAYTLSTGNSYTIYTEDGFGNKSEQTTFVAATVKTVQISDVSLADSTGNITKTLYYEYENLKFGNAKDYTSNTSKYTNGNVRLEFTLNKGDRAINPIEIDGMEISRYKIGSNAAVNLYSPTNVIPAPADCNNVKFTVEGKLANCKFDGSDDGQKTVKVTVSDGVTQIEETKTITLKAKKPEFEVEIKDTQNAMTYDEATGVYIEKEGKYSMPLTGASFQQNQFAFPFELKSTDESIFYYHIIMESKYGKAFMHNSNLDEKGNYSHVDSVMLSPSISSSKTFRVYFEQDCEVTIKCYDKYGNYSSQCYECIGDITPPTFTPCSGTFSAGDYSNSQGDFKLYWAPSDGKAKFEVNDTSGVKYYSFFGNGNELVVGNEAGIVELPGSEDGIIYEYELEDIFANRARGYDSDRLLIKIDNTLPECTQKEKCVGIARPSLGPASGTEFQTGIYYKDLAYTEITVTETQSGLKENGIYLLNSMIMKYKIGNEAWVECPSGITAIPTKAGDKYSNKKIGIYFKPPVDFGASDRNKLYTPWVYIEDACGNKKAIKLKIVDDNTSMQFDNTGPVFQYPNNFEVEVTNAEKYSLYNYSMSIRITDKSKPITVKFKNFDSYSGLYEITGMPSGATVTDEDRDSTTKVLNSRTYTFMAEKGTINVTLIDCLGNESHATIYIN